MLSAARISTSFRCVAPGLAKALFDIAEDELLEIAREGRAAQRHGLAAVDEDGGCRLLPRAGKRDPDVGVLRLAGSIHDAAHDGNRQVFDAWIAPLPLRHRGRDPGLDVPGEVLE